MSTRNLTAEAVRAAHDPVALFERHRQALLRQKRISTLIYGGLFLLALAFALYTANFSPEKLWQGLPKIGAYLYDTLPNLEANRLFADEKTEGSFAYWYFNIEKYAVLLFQTINMALFSTLIAAVLAFIFCFLASRNLMRQYWLYWLARRLMEFCRSVPELVFALLFVWAVGVGPLAGILAIIVHSTGALAKLFSEVNENVMDQPMEGVRSVGGNWFEEIRFGVVPQVLPNFISYTLLRLEINIRASSIIGFVGAGGIGQELKYVIDWNYYEEVSAIVLLIVAMVTIVDLISERLRDRSTHGGA